MCDHCVWAELAVPFVLMGIILDKMGPGGGSRNVAAKSTILNGDAVGTKVSGRYREGGHQTFHCILLKLLLVRMGL